MERPSHEEVGYSLLYVEDDPVARNIINQAISLKYRNVKLLTAENGAVGLELYKEHLPDIVLTDVKMPVMDGIAMTAKIREMHPEAVVVVISAYCDTPQLQEAAGQMGFNHSLPKPLDYKLLFATIEESFTEVKREQAPPE